MSNNLTRFKYLFITGGLITAGITSTLALQNETNSVSAQARYNQSIAIERTTTFDDDDNDNEEFDEDDGEHSV